MRQARGYSPPMNGVLMSPTPTPGDDLATVIVERTSDGANARLHGELDMSNSENILRALLAAAAGCDRFRVELSELEFIDSSGISSLNQLMLSLEKTKTQLTLIAAPESLAARTLALTAMDHVLPMAPPIPGAEG